MKNSFKTICLSVMTAFFGTASVNAQALKVPAASPLQTLKQSFALSEIGIEYSRPSAKGRKVFGDLVPYGKMWRTGANASTKVTFGEDVKIEGTAVKAGTYALYTIPNKDNWELVLYTDLKLGSDFNNYKKENEILHISIKPKTLTDKVETFTINVTDITASNARIDLSWENTSVSFAVAADIDASIMTAIDKALNNDNKPYYQAANYYYENGKDLKIALAWITKAVEMNPKAPWVALLKAKIEFKMKDYTAAAATAEKVITVAKENKYDDYVKMGEDLLAEIKKAK